MTFQWFPQLTGNNDISFTLSTAVFFTVTADKFPQPRLCCQSNAPRPTHAITCFKMSLACYDELAM